MSKTPAAASSPSLPVFRRDRCKHCGICVHFCPKGAIALDAEQYPELVDPAACTACKLCEHLCPDFGIKVP